MIEIRGVCKDFGGVAALRNVGFKVERGEIVLLLGANGAGKSTLLRAILGILPYRGAIRVGGLDPMVAGRAVRARIGYLPQTGGLHDDLTVTETVRFYAALRGADRERGCELARAAGLDGALEARIAELSGGMVQRLRVALAELSVPPVMLLDEPSAGLDERSRRFLKDRLRQLADQGRVIVVATHAEHQLADIADRAITLEDGAIRADVRLRTSTHRAEAATTPPAGGGGVPGAGSPEPETGVLKRSVVSLGNPTPNYSLTERLAPVRPILGKQLRDALHERWLISYAFLLGALGMIAAVMGVRSSAGLGLQMFGRTTATLTNLCLMLAPLVALSLGASAISAERDRGTLENLLAQPLETHQLLLGKYVGLLMSLTAASFAGFLPAALIVTRYSGAAALTHYLLFPTLSILLAAAMLGVGTLISVRSRSGAESQGRAIFVWFLFVVVYDLLLMGTLVTSGLSSSALALLLLLNPVDAARVLAVLALEPDLYLLGPAGALLFAELSRAGTVAVLLGSLLVWAIVPLGLALRFFRLRPQIPSRRSSRMGPRRQPRPGRLRFLDLPKRWRPREAKTS